MAEERSSTAPESYRPSALEKVATFFFAVMLLVVVAAAIVLGGEIDDNKMMLLSVMLAVMAGIVGSLLPGFLHVDYQGKGLALRAAGGAAFFALVLGGTHALMQDRQAGGERGGQSREMGRDRGDDGSEIAGDRWNDSPQPVLVYRAASRCMQCNVIGYGSGYSEAEAVDNAIDQCIAQGGSEWNCRQDYWTYPPTGQ